MSSDQRKRLAASKAQSFRRSRGEVRRAGLSILVVTEGLVTERLYLDEVRRRIAMPNVELVPHGEGAGDPTVLVKKAVELQAQRREKARNRLLSISQTEKFDELWIAFDTDVIKSQKLKDGLECAKNHGVLVASSTPCFEFWLLLHFERTTASFPKCKNVISRLEGNLTHPYSKEIADANKIIPPIIPQIKTAVGHSRWIRKYHEEAGTPPPAHPSTEMDLLVSSILAGASPAHQKI